MAETFEPTAHKGNVQTSKQGQDKPETEKPKRKTREKPVVRIYEVLPNWQFRCVMQKSDASKYVQFESTQEAIAWCKKNLTADKRYQIVTVQREFTMKAKQEVKMTMEA